MSSTAGLRLLADHPVSPCVDRVVHAIGREVGAGGPNHRAQLYVDLPEDVRITERLEDRAVHLRTLQETLKPHLSGCAVDELDAQAHPWKRLDCHNSPGHRRPRSRDYSWLHRSQSSSSA